VLRLSRTYLASDQADELQICTSHRESTKFNSPFSWLPSVSAANWPIRGKIFDGIRTYSPYFQVACSTFSISLAQVQKCCGPQVLCLDTCSQASFCSRHLIQAYAILRRRGVACGCAGAHGCTISGAGPTAVAIVSDLDTGNKVRVDAPLIE